jgi:hypothetical protein
MLKQICFEQKNMTSIGPDIVIRRGQPILQGLRQVSAKASQASQASFRSLSHCGFGRKLIFEMVTSL